MPTKRTYRKRSLSRLIAVQALYQHNFSGNFSGRDLSSIKDELISSYTLSEDEKIENYKNRFDEKLLNQLISLILLNLNELNSDIEPLLRKGWKIKDIAEIVREIAQFGALELKLMKETPFEVIIDEYTGIASSFFDKKEVKFINGLLQNLANKYRTS